jgi:hypothetical protein
VLLVKTSIIHIALKNHSSLLSEEGYRSGTDLSPPFRIAVVWVSEYIFRESMRGALIPSGNKVSILAGTTTSLYVKVEVLGR